MADINTYQTAAQIIEDAAVECGLSRPADVYASTDSAIVQMRQLLTTCGQELLTSFEWPHLIREYTITTGLADTGEYTLPSDFGYMIEQTGWNRTDQERLIGGLTPQIWQYLLAQTTDPITVSFRMAEGEFWVYPQPPVSGLTIAFEYVTLGWVYDADGVTLQDHPDANSDVIRYNPLMMRQMLKLRFLEARGFETGKAEDRFAATYERVTGRAVSSPVLQMAGGSNLRLIDFNNVNDRGFG